MNIKKGISSLTGAVTLSAALLLPFSPTAQAVDISVTEKALSPALYILAEDSDMAMAALKGNAISFTDKDFCRAMNLSKIDTVTVTKLPPMTDGELRVGNRVVSSGQTLSRSELSKLTYTPSGADIRNSSFRFSVNGSPVDMTCRLYHLDEYNKSPTVSTAGKNFTNVSTHKNVTLYGTLPCIDPEGDETVIEIVSYPETGSLLLTDKHSGEYTFIPTEGHSGKDEFKYVARDKYGNYSAAATVTLTVTKPRTSTTFTDMTDSRGYNAALTMAEEGIMSGTQVGTATYFYPNKTVSREDFIVMAMRSIGMRELTKTDKTVFADDSDISTKARDYIGAAYELGYIKGELTEDGTLCFYPDRTITRAEAACILTRMIDAATPTIKPVFSDASDIPAWAAPSIYSLNYMGILGATDGNISPMADLTRADTAMILSAVMNEKK
jgi:hypothetical protein